MVLKALTTTFHKGKTMAKSKKYEDYYVLAEPLSEEWLTDNLCSPTPKQLTKFYAVSEKALTRLLEKKYPGCTVIIADDSEWGTLQAIYTGEFIFVEESCGYTNEDDNEYDLYLEACDKAYKALKIA